MNSKKTIGYLTLPYPIDGHKKILDESTFRELYLNSNDTMYQVADNNGISRHCVTTSVRYYKQFFGEEIREKAKRNYSACAYRRLPYKRLMFLSGEIDKELDVVIEKIKKEMK